MQFKKERHMINVALPKGRLGEKVYNIFEKAGFECPDAPAAGVLVQARPSGEGNRLELQYILALDD